MILAILCVGTMTMPNSLYTGDTNAMQAEANSILHGKLSIEASFASNFGRAGKFFVKNVNNSRYYSKYGIMNSIFFLPPLMVMELFTDQVSLPMNTSEIKLIIFNCYYIFMSIVLAITLFYILSYYTTNNALKMVYALSCLYCTFLWNYTRAHTGEILQVLLFSCLFMSCLEIHRIFMREKKISRKYACISWLLILFLTLQRMSFGTLAPSFIVLMIIMLREFGGLVLKDAIRVTLSRSYLPLMGFFAVLAINNYFKFGGITNTGYFMWQPNYHQPLFGDLFNNLLDLISHPRWSIFLLFIPFLFSMFFIKRFAKDHLFDYLILIILVIPNVLLLLSSNNWQGEMCYGPRLFLFFMPVASIPVFYFLSLTYKTHSFKNVCVIILFAMGLSLGYKNQVTVNYFPFFYDYSFIRNSRIPAEVRAYWERRSFADSVSEMKKFVNKSNSSQVLLSFQLSYVNEEEINKERKALAWVMGNVSPNYYFLFAQKNLNPIYFADEEFQK
jgi:hypothetical protein